MTKKEQKPETFYKVKVTTKCCSNHTFELSEPFHMDAISSSRGQTNINLCGVSTFLENLKDTLLVSFEILKLLLLQHVYHINHLLYYLYTIFTIG